MSELGFFKRGQRHVEEMSFESQAFADFWFKGLTIGVGTISFIVAFFTGKFRYCMYAMLATMLLNWMLFVIAWPCWKISNPWKGRNPPYNQKPYENEQVKE